MRARFLAVLGFAALSACGPAPGTRKAGNRGVWSLPELGILLSQPENERISALDPKSGSTLWTFTRTLPPDPPFAKMFPAPLACPPLAAPLGRLVLHFSEGLYVLDPKSGQIIWKQRLSPPLCAAVTPDSGVIAVTARKKLLTKFDGTGNVVWKVELPGDGAASYGPVVVPVSGDIIVRMGRQAVSFSPEGRLNWTHAIAGDGPEPPAAKAGGEGVEADSPE